MTLEYGVKTICEKKIKPLSSVCEREFSLFYFIYPAILVSGLVISFLVPNGWKVFYLFSSRNLINQFFAYNGNIVFTVLYSLLSVARLAAVPVQKPPLGFLLPIPNTIHVENDSRTKSKVFITLSQIFKLVLKVLILCINFMIIDHLFILTGGNCFINNLPVKDVKDAQVCRKLNGTWKGGFDISGHFCFIVSISLILFNELRIIIKDYNFTQTNRIIATLTLVVLFIWCCLLEVTSVFYHTFFEKVLGLLMGYICPMIIYSKLLKTIIV